MNVPSKMVQFPDEGHWILKPQNSQFWYKTVIDWLRPIHEGTELIVVVLGRKIGQDGKIFERSDVADGDAIAGHNLTQRRRMILPLRVLGKASVKRISSGRAKGPISWPTHWRSSCWRAL